MIWKYKKKQIHRKAVTADAVRVRMCTRQPITQQRCLTAAAAPHSLWKKEGKQVSLFLFLNDRGGGGLISAILIAADDLAGMMNEKPKLSCV